MEEKDTLPVASFLFTLSERIIKLPLLVFLVLILSSCTGMPAINSTSTTQPAPTNIVCKASKTQKLTGFTVMGGYPVWTTIVKVLWYPANLQPPYEGSLGKGAWFVDKSVTGELKVTGRQIDGDGKILFFKGSRIENDRNGNETILFNDTPTEVFTIQDASSSNYLSPIPEGYSGNTTGIITTRPGCYQITATIQTYKVEFMIEAIQESK